MILYNFSLAIWYAPTRCWYMVNTNDLPLNNPSYTESFLARIHADILWKAGLSVPLNSWIALPCCWRFHNDELKIVVFLFKTPSIHRMSYLISSSTVMLVGFTAKPLLHPCSSETFCLVAWCNPPCSENSNQKFVRLCVYMITVSME